MMPPARKWRARGSARGITTVEYALLLAVLLPACVLAATVLYGALYRWFLVVVDAVNQSFP
jgi:hypothetical protein